VLYKLGVAEYSGGRFSAAIDALQQAIRIDEHVAEAHYLLGLCFRELHKTDDARRALEKSVAIAPALLYARQELADLYRRAGRPADRLAQLEALRAIDPGPSREVALGTAYAEAGRIDRAINTLGSAAELYPDHAYTYVALGRVWLDKLQPQPDRVDLAKALGALQGAIRAETSSEALMLFGRALLQSDDSERAESVLQQAASTLPADPLAFYYLAEAAERQDHPEVARRALLDYRALQGDPPDARRRAALAIRIADLSERQGDAAAAIPWYQRAIDATGPDAALLVRLAGAQIDSGALDTARATLVKALELDPSNRAAVALQRRLK
jgi:tetratricopeptide (TPR) repeat protein